MSQDSGLRFYSTGEYQIGLSSGSLEGGLREFGGEAVILFGYEGMDEMEPVSGVAGCGWLTVQPWRANLWRIWDALLPRKTRSGQTRK